jgi:hypothetical protein
VDRDVPVTAFSSVPLGCAAELADDLRPLRCRKADSCLVEEVEKVD